MNLRNLLKCRNAIYGVLAIWIILFHINRRLGGSIQIPVLKQLILSGNFGVDIFMFFSGCCLYLSMVKKLDVKEFYKRRVLRLLPSYLIISTPFWLWRSLVEAPRDGGGFHFIRFFGDISSATFWLTGVETTWFVFAIFAFYLLFPQIYKTVNKGMKSALILLAVVYILNIIGIHCIPIYDDSSIAWTRLPVFILGTMAGKYIDEFDLGRLKKNTRLFLLAGVSGILIITLIIFPLSTIIDGERIPSEYMWLLYGPLTVLVVILLTALLGSHEKGNGIVRRILEATGAMSLELYMSHIIILHWFTYYGWLEKFGLWTFLMIIAMALVVSWGVHYIILGKLTKITKR